MNTAALEATFDAHKVPILATVGAGVAVLAFMRRKSAASAADPTDPNAVTSYATGGQLAGTAGAGGYDSTSTDLYGAISPQLASLEAQIAALTQAQGQKNTPTPVPKPTPAPTPKPAPKPAPAPTPPKHVPTPPKTFHPVVKPAPTHKTDTWVTVAKGQTLSGIAAKYGASITPTTIARTNGIANPNRIYTGQRLHILG